MAKRSMRTGRFMESALDSSPDRKAWSALSFPLARQASADLRALFGNLIVGRDSLLLASGPPSSSSCSGQDRRSHLLETRSTGSKSGSS